ncbi:hypothetical protein U1Q18_037281 [Sarracenia purpurea var. burkii]
MASENFEVEGSRLPRDQKEDNLLLIIPGALHCLLDLGRYKWWCKDSDGADLELLVVGNSGRVVRVYQIWEDQLRWRQLVRRVMVVGVNVVVIHILENRDLLEAKSN